MHPPQAYQPFQHQSQAPSPTQYNPQRQQGIDFKHPGIVLYGMENGPTVAIQGRDVVLSDGTVLPKDVRQLEQRGIRMSHQLKKEIIRLNAEDRMAAERQASEVRIRELQAQEEARLLQMSRDAVEAEREKFSLPDLDGVQPFQVGPGPSGSYL